jgi:hypothetical protein
MVFVLITLTVGVVSVVGVDSLQNLRHKEQVNNMERAFEILDDNVRDVSHEAAPSRATEIKLAGGTIGLGEPIWINVTDNAGTTREVKTMPVVYDDGEGTRIVYAAGAVIRVDDGNGVMLSEPSWLLQSDPGVIQVASFTGSRQALGGSTNMLVVAHRKGQQYEGSFDSGTDDVDVVVKSPRADVWGRYLGDAGLSEQPSPAGKVRYRFTTGVEVRLTKAVVRIELVK